MEKKIPSVEIPTTLRSPNPLLSCFIVLGFPSHIPANQKRDKVNHQRMVGKCQKD